MNAVDRLLRNNSNTTILVTVVLINIRLIFLLVQNELACSFSVESPKSEAVVLRFLTVYKSERFQIQVSASTA